jgi:hypothetical protein
VSAIGLAVWLGGCADLNLGCRFRATISVVGATQETLASSPPLETVLAEVLHEFGFQGSTQRQDGTTHFWLGGGIADRQNLSVTYDANSQIIGLLDYTESGGGTESELVGRIVKALMERVAYTYGASLEVRRVNERVCFGP